MVNSEHRTGLQFSQYLILKIHFSTKVKFKHEHIVKKSEKNQHKLTSQKFPSIQARNGIPPRGIPPPRPRPPRGGPPRKAVPRPRGAPPAPIP